MLTTSLRDLLNEDVHFQLEAAHEQGFTAIKKMISEAPVLKFFDRKASVEIQCGGLGACLLIINCVCQFAIGRIVGVSTPFTSTAERFVSFREEKLKTSLRFEKE